MLTLEGNFAWHGPAITIEIDNSVGSADSRCWKKGHRYIHKS